MTDKTINLGKECSEIPLVAVGDISGYWYAFQTQQAVQNSYGMLKGKWRVLYKKADIKKKNLKYVVMSANHFIQNHFSRKAWGKRGKIQNFLKSFSLYCNFP